MTMVLVRVTKTTELRPDLPTSMMKSIMLWGLAVKSSYHIFLQRAHDINFLSMFFLEAVSTGVSVLIIRKIINTFVDEALTTLFIFIKVLNERSR